MVGRDRQQGHRQCGQLHTRAGLITTPPMPAQRRRTPLRGHSVHFVAVTAGACGRVAAERPSCRPLFAGFSSHFFARGCAGMSCIGREIATLRVRRCRWRRRESNPRPLSGYRWRPRACTAASPMCHRWTTNPRGRGGNERKRLLGPTARMQCFPADSSAPGRTRTCDPRLRRPSLYPAELRGPLM
jgi:hypothetical protein